MALAQLQAQISEAHAELKRGIDADWRASVLRYPEVLDYFYSLIRVKLPAPDSASVLQPPFAMAGYVDRGYEHSRVVKKEKKKRRGEREGSAAPERRSRDREEMVYTVAHRLRAQQPPTAPTPPMGGYPPPPPPPGAFYQY